jgi:hypothetical protein
MTVLRLEGLGQVKITSAGIEPETFRPEERGLNRVPRTRTVTAMSQIYVPSLRADMASRRGHYMFCGIFFLHLGGKVE